MYAIILFVLAIGSHLTAYATDDTDAAKAAVSKVTQKEVDEAPKKFNAKESGDDFLGKRLSYHVDIIVNTLQNPTKQVCIPAGTKLRGQSKVVDGALLAIIRADRKDVMEPGQNVLKTVFEGNEAYLGWKCKSQSANVENPTPAELVGTGLLIPDNVVNKWPENISGLSYGILAVPFKYHLRGTKDFNGGGTVAPYAGFKLESGSWGVSIEGIGFAGLAAVEVQRNVDGKPTKDTLSAFSYGVGAIGRIRENFQLGVVLGADRVSKSSNYPDNGKLWVALSLGYAFSN